MRIQSSKIYPYLPDLSMKRVSRKIKTLDRYYYVHLGVNK